MNIIQDIELSIDLNNEIPDKAMVRKMFLFFYNDRRFSVRQFARDQQISKRKAYQIYDSLKTIIAGCL